MKKVLLRHGPPPPAVPSVPKRKKLVLCGYYGRGSFGDEAILGILRSKISKIFEETSGVASADGLELCVLNTKDPMRLLKTLRGADAFIFGGGSLLQNSTSSASLLYYIAVIRLARRLARRSVMLSNGIGPIE